MAAMGVSRTVVREAVAALRAEGLVTTRQGSGAFVAADASRVPFRIDPEGLSSIGDVLEVMELRLAVEVEAAALAAERITPERLAAIAPRAARHRGGAAPRRRRRRRGLRLPSRHRRGLGQPAVRRSFLEFLGRHVIPRQSVRLSRGHARRAARLPRCASRTSMRRIVRRHSRPAIPPRRARPCATHLTRSLERYRRLAERSCKP